MKSRSRRRANATGRSSPDIRHVRLHFWLLRSEAWRSLKVGPRQLLVELYSLFNGQNNGELFLSVRRAAARLSVAPNTVNRWFRDLEDRGFIRPNQRGGFTRKSSEATTWILTEFDFGPSTATKDFLRLNRSQNQNTVARIATDGIKNCDHDGISQDETARDCIKKCDLGGNSRGSNVARTATQVIYQAERGELVKRSDGGCVAEPREATQQPPGASDGPDANLAPGLGPIESRRSLRAAREILETRFIGKAHAK